MTKTSKRNQKVKEYIIKTIESQGFTEDRYGNWKNKHTNEYGVIRYKFQSTSYRVEKLIGSHPAHWLKIAGTYYKNVKVE